MMNRAILKLCVLFCFCSSVFADDISSLLQQADASFEKGKFQAALEGYENALQKIRPGGERQAIADACYKVGRAYRRLTKFDDALKLLKEALKLHQELKDEHGEAGDLTEIAITEQRRANYDESHALTEKAFALNQQIGNKEGIAANLENFANIYYRRSQYEKALQFFDRAFSAAVETNNKELLCTIWMNRGPVYWRQGDYPEALKCYDQAEKLAREIQREDLLAPIIGNRALVYKNQGNLSGALEDFERCGALFEKSGNKQYLAVNYLNVGSLQQNLGNYDRALESILAALEMSRNLKDKGLEAVSFTSLANIYYALENFETARDYLERSLAISEQTGEKAESALTLLNLGTVLDKQKEPRKALHLFIRAAELFQETGEKRRQAYALQQIGFVYAEFGQFERALAKQKEALAIHESLGDKYGIGWCSFLIGSVYINQRNFNDASALLQRSIDLLRESGAPDLLWPALHQQASVLRAKGEISSSIAVLKEAVELIEHLREKVGLEEEKSLFLENKFQVYDDLVALLRETGDVPSAFEYAERSKARAFVEMLSESRIDPQGSTNPQKHKRKSELIYQSTALNQKVRQQYEAEKPDLNAIEQMKQKLRKLDDEYANLLLEIRKENPRYAQLRYPSPLTLTEAQKLTTPGSALLEYFTGKHSTLFVVTNRTVSAFSIPSEEKLNQQIRQLLQVIQKPEVAWEASEQSHTRYRELAAALYSQVLPPKASILEDKKRLIISPDGPLNYLPFECLLQRNPADVKDFAKLPYLALKYEIQYVPSISALAALQEGRDEQQSSKMKEFIAFADPVAKRMESAPSPAFRAWSSSAGPLPYARVEVDRISKLFAEPDVRVLIGREASETNLKTISLSEFKMVHFASHGLIDEERPQFSALLLNPGDATEDGFVTMREVFDLKLNADLVVLSACKTGLGRKVRGEGLTGLSQAFFAAGASSVLVSLWNVFDPSTAEFMWTFYKSLKENPNDRPTALKAARISLIRSGKFSHPYFWSPFILLGT